jgi:putative peptidoglycan lipid II flippase
MLNKLGISGKTLIVPILLGCGILATLAREVVFASFLGTSSELEVFRLAFAIPNLLSQSLAPAYIGALLPLLVAAQSGTSETLAAFRQQLSRVTLYGVLAVTIVGLLSVSWQARAIAPGFDDNLTARLITSLATCWAFFFFASVSFLPRLYLNSRREFWPGVSTSLVISGSLAIACAMLALTRGQVSALELSIVAVLAGGLILTLHLALEPNSLRPFSAAGSETWKPEQSQSQEILKRLGLVLSIHLLNALPRFIDRAYASDFPQGIVAALEYSFNIITVPGILLGSSVITVLYPSFVRRVQDTKQNEWQRSTVLIACAAVLAASLAGVFIYFFADEIVSLIYERGAFGDSAVQSTAAILAWHGLGLGFMVATMLLLQANLAYGVFKLLVVVGIVRIVAKFLAVRELVPSYGVDGLGASFLAPEAVSTILLFLMLVFLSRKRNLGSASK